MSKVNGTWNMSQQVLSRYFTHRVSRPSGWPQNSEDDFKLWPACFHPNWARAEQEFSQLSYLPSHNKTFVLNRHAIKILFSSSLKLSIFILYSLSTGSSHVFTWSLIKAPKKFNSKSSSPRKPSLQHSQFIYSLKNFKIYLFFISVYVCEKHMYTTNI